MLTPIPSIASATPVCAIDLDVLRAFAGDAPPEPVALDDSIDVRGSMERESEDDTAVAVVGIELVDIVAVAEVGTLWERSALTFVSAGGKGPVEEMARDRCFS